MPIPGAKYRFKKMPGGKAVRLAFVNGKAVEAKPFHKNKKGVLKSSGDATMIKTMKKKMGLK